jgi:hypothetical protein
VCNILKYLHLKILQKSHVLTGWHQITHCILWLILVHVCSGVLGYTVPSHWDAGTYADRGAARAAVLASNAWPESFDGNVTVQVQPLTLNGRIAYHSYSNYLAVPAQDDSEDGNVFIYSFAGGGSLMNLTGSLPVVNAMNPHVAPDGSKVAFMAVPIEHADDIEYDSQSGYWHRLRNNLEIYVYDLASEKLSQLTDNSVPDEDAKFAPDGQRIVFKRSSCDPDSGQVWVMNADGGAAQQKTYTADEKSGPNFSPDGSKILYWSGRGSSADIWSILSNGRGASGIIGTPNLQEYYPVYRNSQSILYTRWQSSTDRHDKIYEYTISSRSSRRLSINVIGAEDSDPFPVDSSLIGFSSQRRGGNWDVFVANTINGAVYGLSAMNSLHHDLGGHYSPYRYARKVVVVAPTEGLSLKFGDAFLVKVQALSDRAIWTGANPSVTFEGSSIHEFTGLRDDGTEGDEVAGDGTYSKSVTLPAVSGNYTVTAVAISTDNGLENHLESESIKISLQD